MGGYVWEGKEKRETNTEITGTDTDTCLTLTPVTRTDTEKNRNWIWHINTATDTGREGGTVRDRERGKGRDRGDIQEKERGNDRERTAEGERGNGRDRGNGCVARRRHDSERYNDNKSVCRALLNVYMSLLPKERDSGRQWEWRKLVCVCVRLWAYILRPRYQTVPCTRPTSFLVLYTATHRVVGTAVCATLPVTATHRVVGTAEEEMLCAVYNIRVCAS